MFMEQLQSATDLWISDGRQPPGFRGISVFVKVATYRLNEKNVSQSSNYLRCPGPSIVQLPRHVLRRQPKPLPRAIPLRSHVEHRRKDRHKRIDGTVFKDHSPTH